jgi:hypothetical protein
MEKKFLISKKLKKIRLAKMVQFDRASRALHLTGGDLKKIQDELF